MGFIESVVVVCLDGGRCLDWKGEKREFCGGGVEIKIKLAWRRSFENCFYLLAFTVFLIKKKRSKVKK
jgi:hypothetical protein